MGREDTCSIDFETPVKTHPTVFSATLEGAAISCELGITSNNNKKNKDKNKNNNNDNKTKKNKNKNNNNKNKRNKKKTRTTTTAAAATTTTTTTSLKNNHFRQKKVMRTYGCQTVDGQNIQSLQNAKNVEPPHTPNLNVSGRLFAKSDVGGLISFVHWGPCTSSYINIELWGRGGLYWIGGV